jgi:hypothetical protein
MYCIGLGMDSTGYIFVTKFKEKMSENARLILPRSLNPVPLNTSLAAHFYNTEELKQKSIQIMLH